MKNLLYSVTGLGLLLLLTGCNSNSCQPSRFQNIWANRPTPIRDYFRGAPCNTCNPPVGQPAYYGTNVTPQCDSCVGGGVELPGPQTGYENAPAPGVPYYPETMINGADFSVAPSNTVGYPPVGSSAPIVGSNTEIETPPMYGIRNVFN